MPQTLKPMEQRITETTAKETVTLGCTNMRWRKSKRRCMSESGTLVNACSTIVPADTAAMSPAVELSNAQPTRGAAAAAATAHSSPAPRLAQNTVFAASSRPCCRCTNAFRRPPSEKVKRELNSTVPA